jgi:hypothetical protein
MRLPFAARDVSWPQYGVEEDCGQRERDYKDSVAGSGDALLNGRSVSVDTAACATASCDQAMGMPCPWRQSSTWSS